MRPYRCRLMRAMTHSLDELTVPSTLAAEAPLRIVADPSTDRPGFSHLPRSGGRAE